MRREKKFSSNTQIDVLKTKSDRPSTTGPVFPGKLLLFIEAHCKYTNLETFPRFGWIACESKIFLREDFLDAIFLPSFPFRKSKRLWSYLLMLPMDPKKFQAASPQLDGEQCG